ncbi:MAG: sulfite exporter TauE/SafE family protein [Planctomycetota bacterium]
MTSSRRISERRRRVLYQNQLQPQRASTAASRAQAEKLREARQPASAFGSRVGRHLRGRWFSLVPVSRLAMAIVAASFLGLAVGLAIAHHMSVTRPDVAYHEAVVRVFRVDRTDSFAAWLQPLVLLVSAGAAYLIYGLRSHSRDDYRGHYRLWRLMIMVLLVGSLQSVVGLIGWLGALVELLLGDRAVLSGANWFRIIVDVGGIILALRLVAETYRNRGALITYLIAGGLLGWYECVYWQVLELKTFVGATLWLTTPLLSSTLILVATTAYLRELFRRARGIDETVSIREWISNRLPSVSNFRERDDVTDLQLRLDAATEDRIVPKHETARFSTDRDNASNRKRESETMPTPSSSNVDSRNTSKEESKPEGDPSAKPKRSGWFGRRKSNAEPENQAKETTSSDVDSKESDEANEKKRRGWFRRKEQPADSADADANVAPSNDSEPPKRKGRFSFRLQPKTSEGSDAESGEDSPPNETPKKKRGWLSGLRRKPATQDLTADEQQVSKETAKLSVASANPGRPSNSSESNFSEEDDADIDWDSMSKAERRRMRRKRKRGGRAA